MRTLHLYLTRQVLLTTGMTVMVFTFILLLANVLREVLTLLVNRMATLGMVVEAVVLLIPWILVYSLPIGMLTATLLVFGRFSADQELTAVRASGVSLLSLVTPILLLGVAMSCVCAAFNLQIGPQCRGFYKGLLMRIKLDELDTSLPEGTFIRDFPGYTIYVGRRTREYLDDVKVYITKDGRIQERLDAPQGKLFVDLGKRQVSLILYDGTYLKMSDPEIAGWSTGSFQEWRSPELDLRKLSEGGHDLPLSDMTITQLWDTLHDLEELVMTAPPVRSLTTPELRARRQWLDRLRDDVTMPVKVQIHSKVSFSFACIGFTLIGIPLGIQAHRRETSVGMAYAIILVVVYYSFLFLGMKLAGRPELQPHLIVWIPNFIFQVAGGFLLWRANCR